MFDDDVIEDQKDFDRLIKKGGFRRPAAPIAGFRSENCRKVGRPRAIEPTPETFDLIERLGVLRMIKKEVIEFFGCSPSTLHKFFADYPDAQMAFDRGFARGRLSLDHLQLRKALRGNVAILIHLGRTRLGQNADRKPRVRSGEIKIYIKDGGEG